MLGQVAHAIHIASARLLPPTHRERDVNSSEMSLECSSCAVAGGAAHLLSSTNERSAYSSSLAASPASSTSLARPLGNCERRAPKHQRINVWQQIVRCMTASIVSSETLLPMQGMEMQSGQQRVAASIISTAAGGRCWHPHIFVSLQKVFKRTAASQAGPGQRRSRHAGPPLQSGHIFANKYITPLQSGIALPRQTLTLGTSR